MPGNEIDSLFIGMETDAGNTDKALDKLLGQLDSICNKLKNINGLKVNVGIDSGKQAGDLQKVINKASKGVSVPLKAKLDIENKTEFENMVSTLFNDVDLGKFGQFSDYMKDISKSVIEMGSVNLKDAGIVSLARAMSTDKVKFNPEQMEQKLAELKEKFKDVGKNFKFAGTAPEAEKQIAVLEKSLSNLQEKIQKKIDMGKITGLETLVYDAEKATNKIEILESVIKSLREDAAKISPKISYAETGSWPLNDFKETLEEYKKIVRAGGVETEAGPQVPLGNMYVQLSMLKNQYPEAIELIREFENVIGQASAIKNPFTNIKDSADTVKNAVGNAAQEVRELGNSNQYIGVLRSALLGLQGAINIPVTGFQILRDWAQNSLENSDGYVGVLQSAILGLDGALQVPINGFQKLVEKVRLLGDGGTGIEKTKENLNEYGQAAEQTAKKVQQLGIMSNFTKNILDGFKGKTLSVSGSLNQIKNSFNDAFSSIKKFVSGAKKVLTLAGSLGKGLKSIIGANDKSNLSFKQALNTMLKYGFGIRSLYILIKRLRSQIIEGYKNLAQYSSEMNYSISSVSSSLTYLKNAFAAAFAPIVNVVAPYISYFIDLMASALNAIGQFFAVLTGKGFAVQATKAYEDYAASLGDTAGAASGAADAIKKLNTVTLGIDELNINNPNDDSSSGSGGGAGSGAGSGASISDMFTTIELDGESWIQQWAANIRAAFLREDWEGLGEIIADGLNTGLQKVYDVINWDNVGTKITYFCNAFTTSFNSLVDNLDWDLLGRTVGAGVNTVVNTLNLLIEGINFTNIGTKLSTGLRGAIDEIEWTNLGNLLGNRFMISWNILNGFVSDMSRKSGAGLTGWAELGHALADSVNGLFDKVDFGTIGTTLAKGINGISETLLTWVTNINWDEISENFSTGINNFFNELDPNMVADALNKFVDGIEELLFSTLSDVNWKQILKDAIEFGDTLELDTITLLLTFAMGKPVFKWAGSSLLAGLKTWLIGKDGVLFAEGVGLTATGLSLGVTAALTIYAIVQWKLDNKAIENWQEKLEELKEKIGLKSKSGQDTTEDEAVLEYYQRSGPTTSSNYSYAYGMYQGEKEWIDKIKALWNDTIAPSVGSSEASAYDQSGQIESLGTMWDGIKDWWDKNVMPLKITSEYDVVSSDNSIYSGAETTKGNLATWWDNNKPKLDIKGSYEDFKENLQEKWESAKKWWDKKKKGLSEIQSKIEDLKKKVKEKWDDVIKYWKSKDILSQVKTTYENIKAKVKEKWDSVISYWRSKDILSQVKTTYENMKSKVQEKWNAVRTYWSGKPILSQVKTTYENIKAKVKEKWDSVISYWSSKPKLAQIVTTIESIATRVSNAWTSARDWWNSKPALAQITATVENILTKIKNAWDSVIDWWNNHKPSLSEISANIKLPHLSVEWDTTGFAAKALQKLGLKGFPNFYVSYYAAGGFPEMGELFIAREAGPELVGRMGSRSTVVNNDQIVAGISSGVAAGMYDANAEQNALLREQNNLLRQLLEKDMSVNIGDRDIARANIRGQRQIGLTLRTT